MTLYDALIVGAGPAGSAAAVALATAGRRTLLLERLRVPRYKTCGGGVLARAIEAWPTELHLDVQREARAVAVHLTGHEAAFEVIRDRTLVLLTMREQFDHGLLRAATAAGAEIVDDCAFEGLRPENGALVVHTTRGAFPARHVLAADGALGAVARQAGWPEQEPGIAALEWEVPVDTPTLERHAGRVRFDIGRPDHGYAWIFPKRAHLSVGILTMRREQARLPARLAAYLADSGIRPTGEPERHGFPIPLRPRSGGPARGRVLLVGDAAGLADPVTGEGISWAIRSGLLAGHAVARGDGDPAVVRRTYRRALRAELLPELRAARLLNTLLYGVPRLRALLFHHCGTELCEALTDVIENRRTYRQLLRNLPGYAKLVWRLVQSIGSRP